MCLQRVIRDDGTVVSSWSGDAFDSDHVRALTGEGISIIGETLHKLAKGFDTQAPGVQSLFDWVEVWP